MTEMQKQQIKIMRMGGHGYKSISTNLGLSRDAIRKYCKRMALDGDAKFVKLNSVLIQRCKYCGKPIKQKPKIKTKIFCCKECREKWWAIKNREDNDNEQI